MTAADVKRVANKYLTQRPRRAQRRADGQARSGVEAGESKKVTDDAAATQVRRHVSDATRGSSDRA